MKRVTLLKRIKGFGCVLVRHGGNHDWYRNPNTGISQPVPRHREIEENLAKHILKMLGPSTSGSGPHAGEPDSI
jgi:predicted RNA binding protein YcfA (HicA-like mRNA interferase family)